MKRKITALAFGLAVVLVLPACAGPSSKSTLTPAQRVSQESTAVSAPGSANTYLAARDLYGERLYRVTQGPPFKGDVQVGIYIGGPEPTNRETFQMLRVLIRENPGEDAYSVNYSIRKVGSEHSGALTLSNYSWEPAKGIVRYFRGEGSIGGGDEGAFLVGRVSGIDSATLSAIADGSQPVPEFE